MPRSSQPSFRQFAVAAVVALLACGEAPDGPRSPAAAAEPAGPGTATAAPPAHDPRPVVVFLGTSLTAGFGLPDPDSGYVGAVAALADSAGIPIRAVNAGVSGETSAGGLRRLDWVLKDPLDVLVVELGANDGLRGQDPAALERNLLAIVRRTKARYPGADVVIVGMEAPPNLGPGYTGRFRSVFGEVARTTGSALVPFLLEGVAGRRELNQEDGIHPTVEGHRIMARTVWAVLSQILDQRTRGRAGRGDGGAG